MSGEVQNENLKGVSLDEAFKQGSDLLSTAKTPQDIDKSIFVFNKIAEQGSTTASLEANWGRALAKKGDWGLAVEHFQRAVLIDRFNSKYREDLDLAQGKVAGNSGGTMTHPSELAYTLASYVRPVEWMAISSLVAVALLYVFLLKPLAPKKNYILGAVFALALVGIGIFSTSASSIHLVAKTDLSLRSAPLESAEELSKIAQGARVRVLRSNGDFAEIERPGQFRGWVKADSLTSLKF